MMNRNQVPIRQYREAGSMTDDDVNNDYLDDHDSLPTNHHHHWERRSTSIDNVPASSTRNWIGSSSSPSSSSTSTPQDDAESRSFIRSPSITPPYFDEQSGTSHSDDDDDDHDDDDDDDDSSIAISPSIVVERIEELVLRSFLDPLCTGIRNNQPDATTTYTTMNHNNESNPSSPLHHHHRFGSPLHHHRFGSSCSSSSSSSSSVISGRRRRRRKKRTIQHDNDDDDSDDNNNNNSNNNDDNDDGPIVPYIDTNNGRRKISFFHNQQSRTMTSIFLVASFCHELLLSGSSSSSSSNTCQHHDQNDDDDDGSHHHTATTSSDHDDDDDDHNVVSNRPRRVSSPSLPSSPSLNTGSIHTRTATTREVYYHFVTHFRNQRECDRAIWDLATLLRVPRQSLGLTASPKGWFCGCIRFYNKETGNLMWDGRELDVHGMPITASTYNDSNSMARVTIESDARCILVIEKEGVYTRLSEDKFFIHYWPSILVTGKGFPDIATRRWVQKLQSTLQIPAFGLCDCNPYGVSVLNSYQYGDNQGGGNGPGGGMTTHMSIATESRRQRRRRKPSKRSVGGGSHAGQHRFQLQWIGLRPSQVDELDLPETAFQEVTTVDKRQLKSLLHESHPFHQQGWNCELRRAELEQMVRYKVELEALNWKGMDFMCRFVHRVIQAHETYDPSQLRSNRRNNDNNDSQTTMENESSSTDGEGSAVDVSPYII